MTSPNPTRQELPIVLRALDRLAQEHHEVTEAQRHERLVALTQTACEEEGLNVSAEQVEATVAQVVADDFSLTALAPAPMSGEEASVASQVGVEPTHGETPKGWQRPASLKHWLGLHRKHQRWGVRWLRSFWVPCDRNLTLLNLSTLLGLSFMGAAVGHWLGSRFLSAGWADSLMILGAIGTSLVTLKLSEKWLNEHHSIQPGRLRPGLAEDVRFCPEAAAYLQACERSEVPLLEGDLDLLRRKVAQHS